MAHNDAKFINQATKNKYKREIEVFGTHDARDEILLQPRFAAK